MPKTPIHFFNTAALALFTALALFPVFSIATGALFH